MTTKQQYDMRNLPIGSVSIRNRQHPEWGTFGVHSSDGDSYTIHNRGHRVLTKDEAEMLWEVV
jgi:hypothetical protein